MGKSDTFNDLTKGTQVVFNKFTNIQSARGSSQLLAINVAIKTA